MHTIVPYAAEHHAAMCAILRTPGIVEHFASQGPPEVQLADPYCDRAAGRLALVDGRACGAALVISLPDDPPWAMLRIGVLPEARRRGVGSALLRSVTAHYRSMEGGPHEVRMGARLPSVPSEAFARAHGFVENRRFLHMRWPSGSAPHAYAWPAGIVVRAFDGSEAMLHDWTDSYNASFAGHWGSFPVGVDDARTIAQAPHFRADGLVLAYRDGACVGSCRTAVWDDHAEIAVLAVDPRARGIGLGRALLRWGVAWLAPQASRIVLIVDEENLPAVALYRADGFVTEATRVVWSRPLNDVHA